jgi:Lipid A 3-O-deacylase (PagL)
MHVPRIAIVAALILAAALGAELTPASQAYAADDPSFWDRSQLQVGIGGTYHFWGTTHATVIPVTLVLDDNRYELGVFRMADAQHFYDPYIHSQRQTADPYWGASASRRWQLWGSQSCKLFFGFGASYKTQENLLSATHWNFASQLGVRVVLKPHKIFLEAQLRHWSNAGIKLPNRGQDFGTVEIGFSL